MIIKRLILSSALLAACICFLHRPWSNRVSEVVSPERLLRAAFSDARSSRRTLKHYVSLNAETKSDAPTSTPTSPAHDDPPPQASRRRLFSIHETFQTTKDFFQQLFQLTKDFIRNLRHTVELKLQDLSPDLALFVVIVVMLATLVCVCILCVSPCVFCYQQCINTQIDEDFPVDGKVNILRPEYNGTPTKTRVIQELEARSYAPNDDPDEVLTA